MMRKSTFILGAIFVALLLYIFAYDIPKQQEKQQAQKLYPYDLKKVSFIEISKDADLIKIYSDDKNKKWMVDCGFKWDGDSVAVDVLFEIIRSAKKQEIKGASLRELGFYDKGAIKLVLKDKNNKLFEAVLGAKNPITEERYLLIGKKVYLTGSALYKELSKPKDNWIEKRLFSESVAFANRVEFVSSDDYSFALSRDAQQNWGIDFNNSFYPASDIKASDMVWDVIKGKIERFLLKDKLKKLDLKKSYLKVKIYFDNKKIKKVSYILSGDVLYAWREDSPYNEVVCELSKNVKDRFIKKEVTSLLPENPIKRFKYTATKLVISGDIGSFECVLSGDNWFDSKTSADVTTNVEELFDIKAKSVNFLEDTLVKDMIDNAVRHYVVDVVLTPGHYVVDLYIHKDEDDRFTVFYVDRKGKLVYQMPASFIDILKHLNLFK